MVPLLMDAAPTAYEVAPFVSIVGGVKGDSPINGPTEDRQPRATTLMLARFGLRAKYGDWLSVESELMANGGPFLHGTSAYEGQAALQVRNQYLQIANHIGFGMVGRFVDEASADFFSRHVADVFMQDTATRDPLLFSGFNLGNGVRGGFRVGEHVKLGLTLNAGNPVSTTGSLMVGGTFSPFDRFYIQPYQAIGKGPNNYPDDSFHMMMATPWVVVSSPYVDFRAAFQRYVVDTDMTRRTDENIHGYNARAGVRAKLVDRMIEPFANVSFARNDTVLSTDLSKRAPEKYQAIVASGGIDVNVARRFENDSADGIGINYVHIQHQIGGGSVTRMHFINVGGTFWLGERVAAGARFAFWVQKQPTTADAGERSVFLTLRYVM
jgi:hypothetical protein